ncbi:pterin-4-alpha-carbinolamine dehydratase [Mycobacterium tuberculosis]|nr:pterin-4-alpha-carbinolamine dehydratase [Mycobacterium tuberculosis]
MAHGNVSRCEESSLHDVCCGRLSALTDRELSERLTALPGWELVDGKLRHTFGFGSFDQSMKFVAKIPPSPTNSIITPISVSITSGRCG